MSDTEQPEDSTCVDAGWFLNELQRTANKELIRHAAGSGMFCSGTDKRECGNILDRSRTVVIVMDSGSYVLCADCWDAMVSRFNDEAKRGVEVKRAAGDILDGRDYWKPKKPFAPRQEK